MFFLGILIFESIFSLPDTIPNIFVVKFLRAGARLTI